MNLHEIETPRLYKITNERDDGEPNDWWIVSMTPTEADEIQERLARGYYADTTYCILFNPQPYDAFVRNEEFGVLEENPDLADEEDDDPV